MVDFYLNGRKETSTFGFMRPAKADRPRPRRVRNPNAVRVGIPVIKGDQRGVKRRIEREHSPSSKEVKNGKKGFLLGCVTPPQIPIQSPSFPRVEGKSLLFPFDRSLSSLLLAAPARSRGGGGGSDGSGDREVGGVGGLLHRELDKFNLQE